MSNLEFKELLRRYNLGNCTEQEKELIESWYMKFELPDTPELTDEQIEGILAMNIPVENELKRKPLWRWASVAAAILVVASTGIYLLMNQRTSSEQVIAKVETDAKPGTNRATLTLGTGKKIVLDSAKTGVLATEGYAVIKKSTDGQIVYSSNKIDDVNAVSFNTMTTPRGGEYDLTLADGTKVWLNAASSITYPTSFVGNERKVEITGEAYFEVSHLANKTFRVVSNGQVVEVLGTHFNVNTYVDEPSVKTTLLQGGVKVSAGDKVGILKPGQQSIISNRGLKIVSADIDQTMAWHNGDFVFNSQTLEEIMRIVSRWYDVEVDYGQYKFTKQTFSGEVSRSRNLSAVIRMIEKGSSLKFKVYGKKVSILNEPLNQ